MDVQKVDRRVQRTRRRLHEALLALILEKGYDAVRVQDILDRADVGRSTFYAHFLNKADLLMGHMRADLFRLAAPTTPARIRSVAWLFEHAGENVALYGALAHSEAARHVFRNIQEGLQRNWHELLEQMKAEGADQALPTAVHSAYLSHALIGLLMWWLDHRLPHTPTEMDQMYYDMVAHGLFGTPQS